MTTTNLTEHIIEITLNRRELLDEEIDTLLLFLEAEKKDREDNIRSALLPPLN